MGDFVHFKELLDSIIDEGDPAHIPTLKRLLSKMETKEISKYYNIKYGKQFYFTEKPRNHGDNLYKSLTFSVLMILSHTMLNDINSILRLLMWSMVSILVISSPVISQVFLIVQLILINSFSAINCEDLMVPNGEPIFLTCLRPILVVASSTSLSCNNLYLERIFYVNCVKMCILGSVMSFSLFLVIDTTQNLYFESSRKINRMRLYETARVIIMSELL